MENTSNTNRSKSPLDTLNIVIAHDSHPPFDVEAIALEEDTALILSADTVIKEIKDHPIRLMTELYNFKEKTPGSVVVKGKNPYRFLAIVHDLEREPSCEEEWIDNALNQIFYLCRKSGIKSLGLQLLGTRYGPVKYNWILDRIRSILIKEANSQLKNLWIMMPDNFNSSEVSIDKVLELIQH